MSIDRFVVLDYKPKEGYIKKHEVQKMKEEGYEVVEIQEMSEHEEVFDLRFYATPKNQVTNKIIKNGINIPEGLKDVLGTGNQKKIKF